MITGSLLTIGAALTGAALVTPFGRVLSSDYITEEWFSNELDFDSIHPDEQSFTLKSGEVCRVFKVKGVSYEVMSAEEETLLASRRATFLHQNFKFGVNLRLYGVKRLKDVSFESTWPSKALTEIGEAERELYKKAYSIEWFMLVSCDNAGDLYEVTKALSAAFAEYTIEPMLPASMDDSAAGLACPLTSFLNYLTCGEFGKELPRISNNISANLPGSDIFFDRQSGLIGTQNPGQYFYKIINVRSWPETVSGLMLSKLLALPLELEVCQVCVPLHLEKTILLYQRKQNEQKNAMFGSSAVLSELKSATTDLVNNTKTKFDTQFQICVRAKTVEELEKAIEQIDIVLTQSRVLASVETAGAALCWFNRLPGPYPLLRPLRLFNGNIAALWPFQFSPEGMYTSPFGDRPVRLFKTPTSQNYALQFHVNPAPQSPGNYLVIAPTGTGKSTLMMHLLGGICKFPFVRNYIFDSKNGARFMVEVMGGAYQGYEELALNPLDTDLSTKTGRQNAHLILRAMTGDSYTEEMNLDIHKVLEMSAHLDIPERTFNNIYSSAFKHNSKLKQAFAKWVHDPEGIDGQYSHVFNAGRDKIKNFLTGSHLVGVNMNEALEDEVLGPAVISHISSAISEAARGSSHGFTIFVDEAANLLQNPGFRSVVIEMFREYRKLDGLVGLAFQDPEALLKFPGAEGILKNTQTLFFMPNSQATLESLEPFNLTSDQIAFIRGESQLAKGRQVLVVRRDLARNFNESAIIDVDLAGLGDAMRFYRAGTSANRDLQELKAKWGDDWLNHV